PPSPEPPPLVESPAFVSGPIGRPPASARPAPTPAPVADPAPRPGSRLDPVGLAIGAYLTIVAWLMLRLAVSLAAVGRLKRRCLPVEEPAWVAALGRWRSRLGIGRRVELRASDRVSVPVVVGWLRPAVILPGKLVGSTALADAVLLHEL